MYFNLKHFFLIYSRSERAFTLTELAIVLGVAGVILGGVWVAGDNLSQRQKVTKALDELTHIVVTMRDLYSGSANVTVSQGNNLVYSAAEVANTSSAAYINAGVIPSDMLVSGIPSNPWGASGVAITAVDATGTAATNGVGFKVAYNNVPATACVALLTAVAGSNHDKGLIGVWTGAVDANDPATAPNPATFPVSASTANATCTNNPGSVGFAYLLIPR